MSPLSSSSLLGFGVSTVRGSEVVTLLKEHVLAAMRSEPQCAAGSRGLGNIEIEEIAGLALRLPSQDHYLTYSILHALIKDGQIEQVRHPTEPRRPKYRLM